jgi:DNA-binding MarR family transcriptional regulator
MKNAKPSPSGSTVDPDFFLASSTGYQIRKTQRMQERFLQELIAPHDIQVGMWYFLRVLWIEDEITQRELSRRVGASEPTTLEQLKKMQQRGLISRLKSKTDRRELRVVLTPEGRSLKAVLLKYVIESNRVPLQGFSKADIERFHDYLHRFRENIRAARATSSPDPAR